MCSISENKRMSKKLLIILSEFLPLAKAEGVSFLQDYDK